MASARIAWETEGDQIDPKIAEKLLYKNSQIYSFLETINKHFIVAGKGLGKTVILKTKRFMFERKEVNKSALSPIFFVPSDTPYLDTLINFGTLDTSKITVLSDTEMAMKIWEFSIQLSVVTIFIARTKQELSSELINVLPKFISVYIKNKMELSPCSILGLLLQKSVSSINQIIDTHSADVSISYNNVHTPMYIFIDKVDQAFLGYKEKMWHSMQIGLMEAAWSCMRSNHHIKIYASLRIEAYINHISPNTKALTGEVFNLAYSKNDLGGILDSLSSFYENKKFHEFIGFADFINPITNENEKVLDYIYRHTTGTPRDLVCIVSKLHETKKNLPLLDIPSFRETVNKSSYEDIGTTTLAENTMFLNALSLTSERERFFSLIHRNLLYREELISICRKFNGIEDSSDNKLDDLSENDLTDSAEECKNCSRCKRNHPFCELNNIGLLGNIGEVEEKKFQTFIEPHELRGNLQTSLNRNSQIYLLHPSLYRHILKARNDCRLPSTIVKFITVLNKHPWTITDDKILELQKKIEDTENIRQGKTRKKLNKIFGDIFKKDISADISKLGDELRTETGRLKKESKNKGSLKLIEQQRKQIQSILDLLSELNNNPKNNKE